MRDTSFTLLSTRGVRRKERSFTATVPKTRTKRAGRANAARLQIQDHTRLQCRTDERSTRGVRYKIVHGNGAEQRNEARVGVSQQDEAAQVGWWERSIRRESQRSIRKTHKTKPGGCSRCGFHFQNQSRERVWEVNARRLVRRQYDTAAQD